MNAGFAKVVSDSHYHIWTDALHARELARQANNRWDRGAYVRWAVNTAWTAFEVSCEDALQTDKLGNRFKARVDEAVASRGLPAIQWGQGIWQRVLYVYDRRKAFTHHSISSADLFAEVAEADETISTLREGIIAIFAHAQKTSPAWVVDKEDRGWDDGRDSMAYGTVIHKGASEDDPNVIRIAYVAKGREHIHCILPPGTDPEPQIYDLLRATRIPINAIHIYHGDVLIDNREINMRGV